MKKMDLTDENKKQLKIAAVVLGIAMPFAALTALSSYFSYKKQKFNPKFTTAVTAVVSALLLIIANPKRMWEWQYTSYTEILKSIQDKDSFASYLIPFLQQIPFSYVVGGLVGVILVWSMHKSKAIWKQDDFRDDPYQLWKKKKKVIDLANPDKSPRSGATIGISEDSEVIIQTEDEAEAHTIITGGSGVGKTVTLMRQAHDYIRNGHGYAMIDLKGTSDETAYILKSYADKYRRPFYHFSISTKKDYQGPANGLSYYDPFLRGDASRLTDLILALRDWSEDHYKNIAQSYLQTAFSVYNLKRRANADFTQGEDTIRGISAYLDFEKLKQTILAMDAKDPEQAQIIENSETWLEADAKSLRSSMDVIQSLRVQLNILKGSTVGPWLRDPQDPNDTRIDFYEAAKEGAVVVFTLDSSTYGKTAAGLANLIIEDLKTASAELGKNPVAYPFHVVIDEFSVVEGNNVIDLLSRARSSKVSVTISTQSLGDFEKIEKSFADRVFGAVNCFMIHRANSLREAEIYAGLIGKGEKVREHERVDSNDNVTTNLETVEDFVFSPTAIQSLKRGELIYVAKSPDNRVEKVKVVRLNIPVPEINYTKQEKHTQKNVAEYEPTIEEIERRDRDVPLISMRTMTGEKISETGADYITKKMNHRFSVEEQQPPTGESPVKQEQTENPQVDDTPSAMKRPETPLFKTNSKSSAPMRPVRIPRPSDK